MMFKFSLIHKSPQAVFNLNHLKETTSIIIFAIKFAIMEKSHIIFGVRYTAGNAAENNSFSSCVTDGFYLVICVLINGHL